jgi:hypothetical protein
MGDRGEDGQRYFKVTPKGRAPKVTRIWPAEEIPWYSQYYLDFLLLLIAIPIVYARSKVPDGGWVAFGLEIILVWIVIMLIYPNN